jgi:hypothetical protein
MTYGPTGRRRGWRPICDTFDKADIPGLRLSKESPLSANDTLWVTLHRSEVIPHHPQLVLF